jgi:hypothetical protein
VFFTADGDLVLGDTNHKRDAYEYDAATGRLSLLSSGKGDDDSSWVDASADGSTAFIVTGDQLVGADRDDLKDLYAVTVDGGSQAPGAARSPCDGAECHGSASVAPADETPGSSTASGAGGAATAPPRRGSPATVKVTKPKAASGSTVSLKVRVSAAGAISASGGSLHAVTRKVTKAATYTMKVGLTNAAKKTLARKKTLKVKVRVAFTPRSGRATSTTVTVTFKHPTAKKTANGSER